MKLAPGEVRALTVTSDPPSEYEISFALLGDALDATLDEAKVVTSATGAATIKLKAPSVPTSFRLRASLGSGSSTELNVVVSESAFGSVRVVPVYAGSREVSLWTASVTPGSNCKSVAAEFPGKEPDGALMVSSAVAEELVINDVPAGPNLAVVLRSGDSMWGCADESSLQAGLAQEVKVTVVDKPLDLLATDMSLMFAYTASEPELYQKLIEGAAARLSEGFLPATSEAAATALLDAMWAAAPADSLASFEQQRAALGWDVLASTLFAALPTLPADHVKAWSLSALAPPLDPMIPPGSQLFAGLRAIGQASGKAILAVSQLGEVQADLAGIPEAHLVTWTADASDTVMLGGSIFWLPSRYAGAAATVGAQAEVPGVMSVPEALSLILGCDALAASMGGFDGCDVACTKSLCDAALAARWEAGLDASAIAGEVGQIVIKASGPAKVNDAAAPTSFDGKWLGTISVGDASTGVEGTVSGSPAP